MHGRMKRSEYVHGVVCLAEHMIDPFEQGNQSVCEALLIGNEEVVAGAPQPARRDTLQKNDPLVRIVPSHESSQGVDAAIMGEYGPLAKALEGAEQEVYVTVHADPVGAGDDADHVWMMERTGGAIIILHA
jgi:hypothetical protein